MRYTKLLILPAMLVAAAAFAADTAPTTDVDKLSYSLGAKTGENFVSQQITINPQQFVQGMSDAIAKKKLLLTDKQMQDTIINFQTRQIAKISAQDKEMAKTNLAASKKFLAENKSKPNVVTLPSGLQYIVLAPGKGMPPKGNDEITVNYRGTLLDGTEFDSSYSRNESSTFTLAELIPGWQEALSMMTPGAKWKLFVPPNLAYGEKGAGRVIQPNSTLIFEIELVKVKPA